MQLNRIDRKYAKVTVTATDADGDPTPLTAVDVALLPVGSTPKAATAWTASTYADGVATVLLAGPDADPTNALPVPAAGADLWIRVVDIPEVDAAKVGRIAVR